MDCQSVIIIMPPPTVKNVKARIALGKKLDVIPDPPTSRVKWYSNFASLKLDHFAYVIFPKNGHINISGIRNFEEDILLSVRTIFAHLHPMVEDVNIASVVGNLIIDNSTASGKLKVEGIRLSDLVKRAKTSSELLVSVRPHYFPSAVIRSCKKNCHHSRAGATIIVFANGKFIIVGARSPIEINSSYHRLCALTHQQ